MVDHKVVDGWLHLLCPVHVFVAHVVDEVELEAPQPELSCRGRQRSMGDSPEDVGVDETDVEESTEDILPLTPASTPNTVVGSHLVVPIHASHMTVIIDNTDRHRQVDDLSFASCWPYNVVPGVPCRDRMDVTFIMPLTQHDAVITCPLHRHALPEAHICQCLRKLPPRRTRRPTQVSVRMQQVDGQVNRREEVVRVEMVVAEQVVAHQPHHYAVAQVLVGCFISRCPRVDGEGEAVAGVRVAQAPHLHPPPPLDRILRHILLPCQPPVKLNHCLIDGEVTTTWREAVGEVGFTHSDERTDLRQLIRRLFLSCQRAVKILAKFFITSSRHHAGDVWSMDSSDQ